MSKTARSGAAVARAETALMDEQKAITAEIDDAERKLEFLQKRQEMLADVLVQLRRTVEVAGITPKPSVTPRRDQGSRVPRPVTADTIKGRVAGVLERAGGAVLQAREVAARAGLTRQQVSVPLVELRHQGLVEHVGPAQYRWIGRDANGGLTVVTR